MNKSITRLAKKFIKRDLKKQLNFEAVEKHLNAIGYIVLFYDEYKNLEIIRSYDLIDYSKKCDAFTVNDGEIKIVFIRKSLSSHDMLFVMLHEVGHIIMGHLECNITTSNKHIQEIEADAFAYAVLNYKHNYNFLYCAICIILTATVSVTATRALHVCPEATQPLSHDVSSEFVQITSSGSKYHRPDCGYVKNKSCSSLSKEEAQKNYEPCSVCNP